MSLSVSNVGNAWQKVGAYESEPIRIRMFLDEFVDIPVYHPIRHRYELFLRYHGPHQRQEIWVPKVTPHHNFLAEPL